MARKFKLPCLSLKKMSKTVIKEIKLPLSFPPATVNAYLINTGNSKILFDTGAKTPQSLSILKNEIEMFGGIDAIILSHGHLDHAGLAKTISDYFDVPIYASFNEKERLSEDFSKRLERRVKKTIKIIDFFNFSDEIAKRELEKADYYRAFMEPLDFLFNFSSFDDSEITFLELSGHTKGSIGIHIKPLNAVLTGDAFLKEGISPFFDPEHLDNTLISYLKSLDKIIDLSPEKVYPGHGNAFENPAAVAIDHKLYIETISEKILQAVQNSEQFKDLLPKLYPANYNVLIAISEIVYALESANIGILQSLKDHLLE